MIKAIITLLAITKHKVLKPKITNRREYVYLIILITNVIYIIKIVWSHKHNYYYLR